jgi:hypothetical protein
MRAQARAAAARVAATALVGARALVGSAARAGSALVCVAALVGVAGCSTAHHAVGPASPMVPWADSVPATLQARTVAAAAPCRASALRVVGRGFRFDPALAGGSGTVTLRNAGPAPCRLTGRPTVRLVGAPRGPAQRQLDALPQPPAFPAIVPPASTLLALPVGAAAVLGVDWRNWCVAGAGRSRKPLVPPRAVRVTLPGALGHLDIGYDAVPACDHVGQPSTIGVRPFAPAPLDATPPWTSVVLSATIEAAPGSRLTGRRGQDARFAVRLHNPSTSPVAFGSCPLVVEALAPAGSPEAHRLNCPNQPIPPSGSVLFEMRIHVPPDAPLGNNGLFWELDPTGAQSPEAVAGLNVTK